MTAIDNRANARRLLPVQGLCYVPAPSDAQPSPPPGSKYFDTDFTNDSFPLIWGKDNQGRGDLANIASQLHVNLLHLYDWSVPPAPGSAPGPYQRNHLPFLDACAAVGIRITVPISNYFVGLVAQGDAGVAAQVAAMVHEVYQNGTTPHAGAGLWGIGNEYDLASGQGITAATVAQTAALILQAEDQLAIPAAQRLPITSPVSFAAFNNLPPAIDALQRLQQAFQQNPSLSAVDAWNTRFIAAVNTFNDGPYLQGYIDTTFPQTFPDLPFLLTEMGIAVPNSGPNPSEESQATYVAAQLAATTPRANFMGRCVFQFLNQSALKQGSEATFGLNKYAGGQSTQGTIPASYTPGGGQPYPVDILAQKPLFPVVAKAYS